METALIICPKETLVPVVSAEVQAQKEMALAGVVGIKAITSQEENEGAVLAVAEVTSLIKQIEKAHAAAKEPYLRTCQALDKAKRDLLKGLSDEELRINTLCGNWFQEQEEIKREAIRERERELQRIENARIGEEARIAEEARRKEQERLAALRREEEARIAEQRRIEEARMAEQRRIESEANAAKTKKAKAEAEAKRIELEKQRALDQERMDRERIAAAKAAEAERQLAELQAEKARKEREEIAAQEMQSVAPVAEVAKTSGQVVKRAWMFEVINLIELSKVRPDLVKMEPRTAEIKEAINLGLRELRGLRIFEETKTSTRPQNVGGKVIEV